MRRPPLEVADIIRAAGQTFTNAALDGSRHVIAKC
jgi:hypothetical protein